MPAIKDINPKDNPIVYMAFQKQPQYNDQEIICLEYSDIEAYIAYCHHEYDYYIISVFINTNYGYHADVKVTKL